MREEYIDKHGNKIIIWGNKKLAQAIIIFKKDNK